MQLGYKEKLASIVDGYCKESMQNIMTKCLVPIIVNYLNMYPILCAIISRNDSDDDPKKETPQFKRRNITSMISNLTAKPWYTFKGLFTDALKQGISTNKWILVNIQVSGNFVSGCLNRDIFNDTMYGNYIQKNFIFYQIYNNHDDILNVYNKTPGKPLLLVIDPFTGVECYQFMLPVSYNVLSIEAVGTEITDFVENYSDFSMKSVLAEIQISMNYRNNI